MIVVFARNVGAMSLRLVFAFLPVLCCPLFVAGSSHALAQGQGTVGGRKG